ncbi:hypothetical protein [Paenibacillus spongiae]|uniref:Holin n=1 Tax=Paenibacillus spongiae TaxID=2909671 RepID=A0ABY5S6R4_9BACL|nr:hypothetical protein [Paenibacillus spongiae]UVI29601.1 hypothetical protein L1F29_29995 [Paenibacillus spongiae]
MEHVIQFAIAAGILVVQYFISKRAHVFAGAALPVIYIGLFIYGYVTDFFVERSTGNILAASIGGTVLLLSAWIKGRESLAKQRKRELNKMIVKDL